MKKLTTSCKHGYGTEGGGNIIWSQEEDADGLVWLQKQGAYVSRDVILVERLPQCLCQPSGHIELQGFTDLHSPLGQKENCGAKQKCSHQGKAADLVTQKPSSLPPPPPASCSKLASTGPIS